MEVSAWERRCCALPLPWALGSYGPLKVLSPLPSPQGPFNALQLHRELEPEPRPQLNP